MTMNIDPENSAAIIRRGYSLPLKRLRQAAIIAAVIHLIAGLYMLLVLSHGLDTAQFIHRLSFLSTNNTWWVIGWLLWTAADLSILFFYCSFADVHRNTDDHISAIIRYALFIAIAGFTLDLIAEVMEISLLPTLATQILSEHDLLAMANRELFLCINRLATMLTGFLANGLYSITLGIFIFATRQRYAPLTQLVGWLVVISGFYLSAACLVNSIPAMVAGNAVLLPLLAAWLLGIAWESRGKSE